MGGKGINILLVDFLVNLHVEQTSSIVFAGFAELGYVLLDMQYRIALMATCRDVGCLQ